MTNHTPDKSPHQPNVVPVAFFFRKPGVFFSIEELFSAILEHLPGEVAAVRLVAPCGGAGWKALFKNCCWAWSKRGDVNHITGDIHYVALVLPGKRTILTVHDLRVISGPPGLKKALLKLLWFTLPARRVRFVTVVSEATRRELISNVRIDPDKVRVIPNCVFPCFTFSPNEFNPQRPVILQVGTTDNKNIPRLAEALKGIDCQLQILGQPTEEQIRVLDANGINFRWVAGISSEEVVHLYRACDLVVFVSTCEGFGLPIIEANAVGRPVITSSLSSMPEVAGDAALLVDPYDVAAIRAAVLRVIGEPGLREVLVANGLKNVERFTPQKIAAQYAQLYAEVCEENVKSEG